MISHKNIGILGGGQLGKMLCEAASPWHLNMHILDENNTMPASSICTSFTEGSFKDYDDVLRFGKKMDVITIEIEHVNLEALIALEKMGKEVHPKPGALLKIVDKGLQKEFYKEHGIPTSTFDLLDSASQINSAIDKGNISYPFIQKTRKEGYDGRGVQLIASAAERSRIMDVPSVIEELIDIDKELAVISARNKNGQIESFEPVEMEFREGANLLDLLRSPADLSKERKSELIAIAEEIIDKMDIVGVLAVEFFLDKSGKIYVNEIAPRPHNSGHQSIENNIVSQYEQHLRAILNLPLIKPKTLSPAIMINILGEEGYEGNALLEGIEEVLGLPGVYPHWYGKKITKPFRKMGHITLLDNGEAIEKVKKIRKRFKVKAKNKIG